MEHKESYIFQVNLKGMISLLSEHLYSNPNTFVRELLQNAVDAITAVQHIDEYHEGKITVRLALGKLIFEDNGIGLTESEIHQFIAVIGESSKRNSVDAQDFIGKFGIGLLSCFVVSNEIVLETRSAMSENAVRWTGLSNGTYQIEPIAEKHPIGTRVILSPKKEWAHLFTFTSLQHNLSYYGDLLPIPIECIEESQKASINDSTGLWLTKQVAKDQLLKLGNSIFHTNFIDAFCIDAPTGGLKAIVYILPHKAQFSNRQSHKLYLKRMFLSDDDCRLLPKWAFFVRCIINTDFLQATASRESLMTSDTLKETQKEIAEALKDYLRNIRTIDEGVYHNLIHTHYLHIKAIAAEDIELLSVFLEDLPFETNKGVRTFKNIRQYQDKIYYTPNIDDFKQMRRIAESQGLLVINAAYTFEEELLKKAQRLDSSIRIKEITPRDILASFHELAPEQEITYLTFLDTANEVLNEQGCEVIIKSYTPLDIPSLYIASNISITSSSIKKSADNPLNDILGSFSSKKNADKPVLCLNSSNKLINNLLSVKDDYVIRSVVHVLYVQSLLLGKYPVNDREMTLFNEGINNLLIMGIDNFINI
ncbi:HSP90 family protein [Sphingobacterium sp. SYP-B4668]|uniref:HSP90 family protein n=1 Tax=Sphingobacterium sp. SYP-B4668 TaxID=2996035 RepID=UPI0022DE65B9|nr:HSP90 family protein [Sphingobacterium sp. SYP-B4668]